MSDGEPMVPVVCSACETEGEVPLSEVADHLDRHNDRLHDGEAVAAVDPDLADALADVIAEDMDLI